MLKDDKYCLEILSKLNSDDDINRRIKELDDPELGEKMEKYLSETHISESDFRKISVYDGFLGKNMPIVQSLLVNRLYCDDDTYIFEFIKKIKPILNENFYVVGLLNLIHWYTVQLLGRPNYEGKKFCMRRYGFYESVYLEEDSEEDEEYRELENSSNVSIKEFYNKNKAICFERACITQNLLSFCGVKSKMVFGEMSTCNGKERHAFNIINYNNKDFLFDVTNPINVSIDGKIQDYIAVMPIENIEEEIVFDRSFIFWMLSREYPSVEKETNEAVDFDNRVYSMPPELYNPKKEKAGISRIRNQSDSNSK